MEDSNSIITVKGIFPFLKREELFVIDINSSYADLISTFCEELDEDNRAIVLSALDASGWSIYIRSEVDNEMFCVIHDIFPNGSLSTCLLTDLKDDDDVVLSRSDDVIRPRRLLPCLLQELIMHQVLDLLRVLNDEQIHAVVTAQISAIEDAFLENSSPGRSRGYCGYRNLRSNDGNSYYRSVYFSLFEQIILHRKHHLFGQLRDLFRTHGFKIRRVLSDRALNSNSDTTTRSRANTTSTAADDEDELDFMDDPAAAMLDEDFDEFLTTLNCAASK